MDWSLIIPIISGVAALFAAYAVFRKAPSEATKFTAEGNLLDRQAQSQIIDDLQSENSRIRIDFEREIEALKKAHAREIALFQRELKALREDNSKQSARIKRLEERLTSST